MRKFLGVSLVVAALTIVSGVAIAQLRNSAGAVAALLLCGAANYLL